MARVDLICTTCGIIFNGYHTARFCTTCRHERQKEKDRRLRREGANRKIGSSDNCTVCGKVYIVESGVQKYCRECRPERYLEMDRAGGIKYYEAKKDQANPVRNEKRRLGNKICVVCSKEYPTRGSRQITCSPECKKAYENEKWRKFYKENPDYQKTKKEAALENYYKSKNK